MDDVRNLLKHLREGCSFNVRFNDFYEDMTPHIIEYIRTKYSIPNNQIPQFIPLFSPAGDIATYEIDDCNVVIFDESYLHFSISANSTYLAHKFEYSGLTKCLLEQAMLFLYSIGAYEASMYFMRRASEFDSANEPIPDRAPLFSMGHALLAICHEYGHVVNQLRPKSKHLGMFHNGFNVSKHVNAYKEILMKSFDDSGSYVNRFADTLTMEGKEMEAKAYCHELIDLTNTPETKHRVYDEILADLIGFDTFYYAFKRHCELDPRLLVMVSVTAIFSIGFWSDSKNKFRIYAEFFREYKHDKSGIESFEFNSDGAANMEHYFRQMITMYYVAHVIALDCEYSYEELVKLCDQASGAYVRQVEGQAYLILNSYNMKLMDDINSDEVENMVRLFEQKKEEAKQLLDRIIGTRQPE